MHSALRSAWKSVSYVAIVATIISCGGDGSITPDPDPIDPNSIEAQITALYPAGPTLRDAAMTRAAAARSALAQSNATVAKSQALALVDLTLASLTAGTLTGGRVASTRASASRLIDAVYKLVGLTAPAIPDGALTDDGAARIIGPAGGTLATPNGGAGVQFPAGTLPSEVLVTIVRIPATTPGNGPLPTTLKQYPPYYDFATTPLVVFSDSARVGICQVTDASSPFYPPEPHDKLRLAHTVQPGAQPTVEILERVGVDDIVRCASVSPNAPNFDSQFGWKGALRSIVGGALDMVRPSELFAAHGGLGGKTKSFSPFGAVDPTSGPVASVTVTINPSTIKVNENALANAVLKDASGNILTGRSITWSTGGSPFVSVGSTTGIVTGNAPGVATITATSEGKTGTVTVTVVSTFSVSSIEAGFGHSCAIGTNGSTYCWGRNDYGGLGDGTLTSRTIPTPVTGTVMFQSVSPGVFHTCALTSSGAAYCWGLNADGELGDGTTTGRLSPVPVAGGLSFKSIEPGYEHTCGLTVSGATFCWGSNRQGQLGDGTFTNRQLPTAAAGALIFSSITSGNFHTCGLTSNAAAYCWGYNGAGQLGDGTTTSRASPAPVGGSLGFQTLGAGIGHTCGLTTAGVAYCWGANGEGAIRFGQLGDGTTSDRSVPTAVAGGLTFQALFAGGYHSCGLTAAGATYCWGRNGGELGDGTTTDRSSPVVVVGGLRFEKLTIGGTHTCARTSESVAYCWGGGAIGNGSTTVQPSPVLVRPPQ